MLFFENDYGEGAHEAVLKRLAETNYEQMSGYGTDPCCAAARDKIHGFFFLSIHLYSRIPSVKTTKISRKICIIQLIKPL